MTNYVRTCDFCYVLPIKELWFYKQLNSSSSLYNNDKDMVITGLVYYTPGVVYRVRQIPFFWKMLKKKLLNIISNFFFYLKVQSFRLIMENNFIQMAASACHAGAYTIGPIFKHIIDYV